MDTRYIYAGSRARAMENNLLTEAQLEALLGAKTIEETYKILQDTFLASHIVKFSGNINDAISLSLLETKHTLLSIAPEPELLEIIWLKYDFYNFKTIIKAKIAGLAVQKIKNACSLIGNYDAITLIKAYEENKLHLLNKHLDRAAKEASSYKDYKDIANIDIISNKNYFIAIREIAQNTQSPFIKKYIALTIDLFNILTKLRILSLRAVGGDIKDIFIPGGNIIEKDLRNEKDILDKIKKIGNEKRWLDALDYYRQRGNYILLEKAAADLKTDFLKEESYNIFSIAPLFSYFGAKINNTSLIRAIINGKILGIPEKEIRLALRKIYA